MYYHVCDIKQLFATSFTQDIPDSMTWWQVLEIINGSRYSFQHTFSYRGFFDTIIEHPDLQSMGTDVRFFIIMGPFFDLLMLEQESCG